MAGNIKVLNKVNWLTRCQALEYILGISIYRRALDVIGAVPVVPGSLGAFRRKTLESVGLYDRDTVVEDFDLTIKLLKIGRAVQASSYAFAYTEAPQTLKDFYNQRMRWYRGNVQVLIKHRDTLINPRYGALQKFIIPYILISMIVTPLIGFIVWAAAIYAVLIGVWLDVLKIFLIFCGLQALLSLLAVEIDEEDRKLVAYAPFFVVRI